ncbi:substrate-binding domain-containing protein [Hydrogenophaga sp.]|uniref:LacI family DNA-binding transcriptional regulator n=1 Tax=Hydrogenophaga sp. TaxID=1904254 RepID=UPI00261A5969|nr:substrate-binding domain-containing protein [Hydrogenophaga sp.]MDM7950925.1 substrate-binding domain-containing protein [Hydrogenophaga sp.]
MSNKSAGTGASRAAAKKNGVVTIERVAELAGVSPSTVSRILNGTAVVSAAKKAAVDQAVAQLGFVPNPMARGLAGGRSMSIGVVTQAIDSPFYGASLRGVEDALDPAGYSPLFVSGHWDAQTESRCIDILLSRRVDGIIVLTGRLTDAALKSVAKRVPTVVTGRSVKAPGLFSLNFENAEGGRLATRYLIDGGHCKIAFISGDPRHPDATQRLMGYRTALEQAGIPFKSELVVQGEYNEASGVQAVSTLMASRQKFTAVFAANDQMAIGAAHGLQRHGLRVPDDVSLVGFDDLPTSLYALPPLTTVHQPAYDMGRLAAQAVLQLLDGTKPTQMVPPPRLIVRDSCRRLKV